MSASNLQRERSTGKPDSASATSAAAGLEAEATAENAGMEECDSPCGLTPASLKHLRRQNTKLTDERARLQGELAGCQVQVKEQRERANALEVEVQEGEVRQERLRQEVREAEEREEVQRSRVSELEGVNARLEESLAGKEAEVARLRQALEEQLQLTKDVCEAAERSNSEARAAAEAAAQIARLEEQVRELRAERDALEKERQRQEAEKEDYMRRAAMAMEAAEKAMAIHAMHLQRAEQLRVAKLAEAIQHKVELHISVPRVTLSYNNAPPLLISAAAGLGEARIKDFLNNEVFNHFEPLWVSLDAADQAPDGTSKKAYSTRMLERLTDAVKGFVEKSQRSDADSLLGADAASTVRESSAALGSAVNKACGAKVSAGDAVVSRSASRGGAAAAVADGVSRSASRSAASRHTGGGVSGGGSNSGAAGGGGNGINSLSEADRSSLLGLLRNGDDRGLDGKLAELLKSRA